MPTALITGVLGQDGSYLAEQLVADGWRVVGAVRDPEHDRSRLRPTLFRQVELEPWRTQQVAPIADVLASCRPSAVFNFAARSSGADMYVDPVEITEANAMAVVRILEAILEIDPAIRFCQASSSEMFGEASETPQSEATPFRPRSPYGAAKLLAHNMVGIQRRRHGLFACSAILFNHESPRRGEGFVTRKIARGAARIKLGLQQDLYLGNLEARRDWGHAADYVRAMRLMLEQPVADDYVIASGTSHSVREFCDAAFGHVGLDYRDFVKEDSTVFRPPEPVPLVGDATKAAQVLGWRPTMGFHEIVRQMVDCELDALVQPTRNS